MRTMLLDRDKQSRPKLVVERKPVHPVRVTTPKPPVKITRPVLVSGRVVDSVAALRRG